MLERELSAILKSGSQPHVFGELECPDAWTLAAYWDGGLEPGERTRIERHLAACRGCLAQIAALARLDRTAPEPVPEALLRAAKAAGRDRPHRPSSGMLTALAASLLVLLGLALWIPGRLDDPSRVRAPLAGHVAPDVVHPIDGGLLRRDQSLRWRPVDGALFYRVRLTTDSGDPIWEAEATGAELELPGELELIPGELYFVWVRAHRSDGETVKSPAVGFRVVGSAADR